MSEDDSNLAIRRRTVNIYISWLYVGPSLGPTHQTMGARASKALRPAARTVENAQDLDRVALQPVRHDERRPRNHELARSRNPTRPPHLGALGSNVSIL